MRRNDEIQAALISWLKSNSTIIAELDAGATEIREDQWQGDEFTYPNIRVRMISNSPQSSDCNFSEFSCAFQAFSEDNSSLEADRIAGIINNELHEKAFQSNNIAFTFQTTDLVPAIRSDRNTWRSEVLVNGIASG